MRRAARLPQDMNDLSRLPFGQIENDYAAKVRPGKHSLILPLGARATLIFPIEQNRLLSAKQPYLLELTDINGTIWSEQFNR
jgi:thiosulfate dehydrogenase (quinone)